MSNLYHSSQSGGGGSKGDPGLAWKGQWNGTTPYRANDVVEHDGCSYVAVAANTNQPPPADCWNLLAAKGADGSGGGSGDGSGLHWAGAWSSSTAYKANDVVTCEGSAYIARVDNTNIVPPDTSGGPAVYSGWVGGNSGNPYGGQVTFTAKTVTPALNGFVFTIHCVPANQVPSPPYSYNRAAKTCDIYLPTPSGVYYYIQAAASLFNGDDGVDFVLTASPERSGPLYSEPVVCVQTLRSGEDTWYTLSESADNFLYGLKNGERDILKKGTPVSLYFFQGWGGTPTGTAGWADDGNGNSLTWQSATADEQWNHWGFVVVEDNSDNTASGPMAQVRDGGQDEPAHMVEIHVRSDQTTAFSAIWSAIAAVTNGAWTAVSNNGTFDPAVFGTTGSWFMSGANNAIPADDEPRLYRTDPNGNWTDQATTRPHQDGSLNANCLGLIAADVAAGEEALVQIGGTIELDSTAWTSVLVKYIPRQFHSMPGPPGPGPGGGGYWSSERTDPVGELDPGKLYMTYVSLAYSGSIQSVGALTATTGLLKGVVQGEDTGGNPTSLAPYYVPVGIALSPTKLLLRLGSGAF